MPRLKPPPSQQQPTFEDNTPPVDPVEIELPGEEPGSTEVDLAPEPKPEPKPAPVEEDNPLQKALDAQKQAEELQRAAQRERDDALRQARERDTELVRERGDREDAQYNSVLTAIAAEQSTLDKAEADYAGYASVGDWQSAGKAQRIMSSASARLDRLEDGKLAFEQKREAAKTAPPAQQQTAPLNFEEQIAKMPESAKSWLRQHPEFINDTALNAKIGNAHNYLIQNRGVEPFSPKYFEELDKEFGFKTAEAVDQQQPQRRSMPLTAPVSRDVPTASGQRQASTSITLSQEERLIARTSFSNENMTNAQKELLYAQNKRKLQKMRSNGEYRQTTEQTG